MSRRIFVAGASGVLGRRVVPALVAAGHTVTANVRTPEAAADAAAVGATPATVDLFDAVATRRIGSDHDVIVNVATSIPTGASAALKSAWKMNDRLRRDASMNLAAAMVAVQGRYVGESITFPYVDGGAEWIDEAQPCAYIADNETCRDALASAEAVTVAGGVGITLRFAMFHANDSAHIKTIRSVAKFGVFGIPGDADAYMSWIHIDDAATAVVAALDAPAGIYNVAEPDPTTRSAHAAALAQAVGRKRVRLVSPRLARLGGASLSSLTRSQRISSRKLFDATGWHSEHAIADAW